MWGKMSQRYWLENRAVGDGVFEVRESKDETDGGAISSYPRAFKLNLIDPNTGNETGEYLVIPGPETQKYLVATTTTFKSKEAFEEALTKYKVTK